MVRTPIKIDANDNESCSNVTNFEIKGITNFYNNIENLLNAFMNMNERVVKSQNVPDKNKEFKMILELLQLICITGPAMQILQIALKLARTRVVHQLLAWNNSSVSGQKTKLVDRSFFNLLDRISRIWTLRSILIKVSTCTEPFYLVNITGIFRLLTIIYFWSQCLLSFQTAEGLYGGSDH